MNSLDQLELVERIGTTVNEKEDAMTRWRLHSAWVAALMMACGSNTAGPTLSDFASDRDGPSTRVPAEWEPQDSVWVQWPQDHEASYRASFVKMVDVIQQYEPVDIVVLDEALRTSSQESLQAAGVSLANITFHIAKYDGFWNRDNGPVYVFDQDARWLQDWGFDAYGARSGDDVTYDSDNEIPFAMSAILGSNYEDYDAYILERGNLEANGIGTVALNWDCQRARNPTMSREETEELFRMVFGATQVIWVDGHDPYDITTGHIDGILRFVNDDTVLIAERTDPEEELFNGELEMLQSAVTAAEELGFNVVRMPMPGNVMHDGEPLPVIYMNYLVGNGFVLGMEFGVREWDDDAKSRLELLYPSRAVHMIEVNDLWASGGGVHCVTNDAPRFE